MGIYLLACGKENENPSDSQAALGIYSCFFLKTQQLFLAGN
jgi:hypothetical protein